MVIEVTFDVTDVYISTTVSPVYVNVSFEAPSGGGGAEWGDITGTLSDQTDLQSALDLKVPYTGATTNVNLGEYEIKAGQLTLDTSPTGTAAVGTTRWNDTIGSSETTLKGGSVILKNGVDLVARVVNKVSPNTTLTKAAYQAVRVSGAQGQRLAVELAQANNDANSADTIGLVTETIATNQEGFIITVGQLENINTTGSLQSETWADGDVLYLSPTIAGAITKVKPTGNGHIVVIGYVEYAHANNGKIYVKVMNGWELDELHDVAIVSPANNEALIYESATALWKNKSIATALGYTPANAATTLTINGVTFDLSANRTFTVGSVTGSGASGQVAYWTGTSAQSGSNNLFWDATNSRLGIGTNAPTDQLHISNSAVLVNTVVKLSVHPNHANIINFRNADNSVQGGFLATGSSFSFGTYTTNQANLLGGSGGIGLRVLNTSASSLVVYGGNASADLGVKYLQVYGNTGNVLIQNGGTFTDSGQRLQVTGDTLLKGSGNTSATTALTVQNSDGTNLLRVRNTGDIVGSSFFVGTAIASSNGILASNPSDGSTSPITSASDIALRLSDYRNSVNSGYSFYFSSVQYSSLSYTTGIGGFVSVSRGFAPTSGTGVFNAMILQNTINQTGGANGITRGLLVSPILTAAADWRSIEWSNNSGWGLYGAGTANNYLGGNLLLGSTTNSGERLQVTGNTLLTGGLTVTGGARIGTFGLQLGGVLTIAGIFSSGTINQEVLTIRTSALPSATNTTDITLTNGQGDVAITSGTRTLVNVFRGFNPTSGTGVYNLLLLNGNINQTGGANGITRGLYVNPTLTAAADFRAIETARGNVIFGNLPTSPVGLPTGAIWNNLGMINIV